MYADPRWVKTAEAVPGVWASPDTRRARVVVPTWISMVSPTRNGWTDRSDDSIRISPGPGRVPAVTENCWKGRLPKSPTPTIVSRSWPEGTAQRAVTAVSVVTTLTLGWAASSAATGTVVGAVRNWMSGWPVV